MIKRTVYCKWEDAIKYVRRSKLKLKTESKRIFDYVEVEPVDSDIKWEPASYSQRRVSSWVARFGNSEVYSSSKGIDIYKVTFYKETKNDQTS